MIKTFLRRSLRHRLLVAFVVVGFVPYFLFLLYMLFLSETKIVQQIVKTQYNTLEERSKIISLELDQIAKEVRFLSRLEVMNDIISEDIDKRIATLLEQKAKDLQKRVSLYVTDTNNHFIASSSTHPLSPLPACPPNGFIQRKEDLLFCQPIFTSFEPKKRLGSLYLLYPLTNLTFFLPKSSSIFYFFYNPKFHRALPSAPLSITLTAEHGKSIVNDYLIVYKALRKYLDGWYIVYAQKKEIALSFFYDFLSFMFWTLPFIVILLLLFATKLTKTITLPIEYLTQTAQEITRTKNYAKQLPIEGQDEIAKLTLSFNQLLQTTNEALLQLEEENRIRLQRFVRLIEIFNTIIQTQTPQECIRVSIEKIKELTQDATLAFTTDIQKEGLTLTITNFDTGKKEPFGRLLVDKNHLQDPNEKAFYLSITKMIALQIDRIHLIEKTLAASKAKSAFISNMSHELRTPLNAILGFTQYLIEYEELSEEQKEIVQNIESSARHLLEMINDILDIAKIEAGKMEPKKESVTIPPLFQDVVTMLEPLAKQKELKLSLHLHLPSTFKLVTDAKMVKQILINLISNAIKFTPQGYVKVEASLQTDQLRITIEDSGIGIDPSKIDSLFEEFTQIENVIQKRHKGTGLGLALCKKMARLLGGDVWLESEGEGKGTKAFFILPL